MSKRYQNLAKLLKEFGESDFIISKALVFKIGCVAFAEALVPDDCEFPVTESEKLGVANNESVYRPPKNVGDQIFDALEKHPNVFDITKLGKGHIELVGGTKLGFLVTSQAFTARIHLPKNQQKYRDFGEPEEHFKVISRGSVFAAWNELGDIPVFSSIAHEFREIMQEQIPKVTSLKSPNLGPTPIHPDFVLIFGGGNAGASEKGQDAESAKPLRCFTRGTDVYLLFEDTADVEKIVWDLFFDIYPEINNLYRSALTRSEARGYEIEIYNHFSDLSKSFGELIGTAPWKVLATRRHSRAARAKLAILHTRLVETENALLRCQKQRDRLLEEMRRNKILSGLLVYFSDMLDPHTRIPNSLPPALQFFEGELQLYANVRSLLAASLIGAIVGSIVTGLLTLLIR